MSYAFCMHSQKVGLWSEASNVYGQVGIGLTHVKCQYSDPSELAVPPKAVGSTTSCWFPLVPPKKEQKQNTNKSPQPRGRIKQLFSFNLIQNTLKDWINIDRTDKSHMLLSNGPRQGYRRPTTLTLLEQGTLLKAKLGSTLPGFHKVRWTCCHS